MQRGHQAHGGLGVVGAAAPGEQLGLGHQPRVLVLDEQLGLELGHHLGPGAVAGGDLLGQLGVAAVVVVQVVGGEGAQQADEVDGGPALELELGAEPLQQPGQPVDAVDGGRADPGEVVEADVLEVDGVGVDPAQVVAEPALHRAGHVAQPHRPVALVGQGLGHDPHRVGEVDQPGPGRGPPGRLLGQLEHERDRPQRLGQSPGPGGLLPQAAVAVGQGLVREPSRLAAHPQLDHHEGGAVEGPLVRSPVASRRPVQPRWRRIRSESPATGPSRSGSGSSSTSSSTARRSSWSQSPSTSSGV